MRENGRKRESSSGKALRDRRANPPSPEPCLKWLVEQSAERWHSVNLPDQGSPAQKSIPEGAYESRLYFPYIREHRRL